MRSTLALWCVATLLVLASASSEPDDDEYATCPPDSELDDAGQCVCATERCHALPSCPAGFDRSLRRPASDKPGECCEVYECEHKPKRDCSNVTCPKDVDCPDDSYRLPKTVPDHACCGQLGGCMCSPGTCAVATCAVGEFAREVRAGGNTPGQCCPLYQCLPYAAGDVNATCATVDGAEVTDGAIWRRDACTECACAAGMVTCSSSPSCDPLPPGCLSSSVPAGGCCPQCDDPVGVSPSGCVTSGGDLHANGARWKEDPCTLCECKGGRPTCTAEMCDWACAEPRHVADECCPLCDHDANQAADGDDAVLLTASCPPLNGSCALRCVHGFRRDDNGCFLCQCQAEQCTLECSAGFAESAGRKLCACAAPADCPPLSGCRKLCHHGFKVNRAGCETCRCRACPALACVRMCAHGFAVERGCPTCRCRDPPDDASSSVGSVAEVGKEAGCLTTDGRMRAPGATWQDGCRHCLCHAGAALCSACAHCVDGNATFAAGESWNRDPCTRCTCDAGTKSCTQQVCGSGACAGCGGHSPPGALLQAVYLLVITVLFCTSLCLALYVARRCCRRRRLVVSGPYRAPETPPPQYASADRRLPHLYRFVSPFDSADRPPDKTPASPAPSHIK